MFSKSLLNYFTSINPKLALSVYIYISDSFHECSRDVLSGSIQMTHNEVSYEFLSSIHQRSDIMIEIFVLPFFFFFLMVALLSL